MLLCLQKAVWQNDSDEETAVVENGEVHHEEETTEGRTDETEEMLASSRCKKRKCGYCGIYVSSVSRLVPTERLRL